MLRLLLPTMQGCHKRRFCCWNLLLFTFFLLQQQQQCVDVCAATEPEPATIIQQQSQQQQNRQQKTEQPHQSSDKPHIIIILIDDMGFNDLSFHGSNQILTPNIDALAYNGIILNRYYVPNLCTPSRATLLTGKYPIHTGTQNFVIINDEPWGLPLSERIMPELFREAGYATNIVGKWHLGFWRKDLTPTMRGFDHHFGYYSGYIDYYDHTLHMLDRNYSEGLDFRNDFLPVFEANGTYATDAFTQEAVRIINEHDSKQPLFLLMSHLAVHTGNEDNPMQAPQEEVNKFLHIADEKRRKYAGMISSLDRSVGQTMQALAERQMLNNSIVLLYSDNGAPTVGIHSNAGSNYPFRGQKESPWEGALRSAGAIWSPLLQQQSYVSNQLIHAADWLPTLAAAANIELPSDLRLDGVNLWQSLSQQAVAQPRRLLHVLDNVSGYSSFMRHNWKYINGTAFNDAYGGWLGELPMEEADPNALFYAQEVLSSEVQSLIGTKKLTVSHIDKLRTQATIRCPSSNENAEEPKYRCKPLEAPCLFDIEQDPCERFNLAEVYPLQVKFMQQEVEQFLLNTRPSARIIQSDIRCDPVLYDGMWQWWNETKAKASSGASRVSPWGGLRDVVLKLSNSLLS